MEATASGRDSGAAVLAGAIAGVIAGIVLAIVMMLVNASNGADVWIGAKAAAAPFLGARASAPGFDGPAVLTGVIAHLVISVLWGAAFGLLFVGISAAVTVAAGLAWGMVVWIVMYYVVLPLLGLGAMAHGVPVGRAALNHLVFGLVLGLAFVPLEHRLAPGAVAPWIDTRRRRDVRAA